MTKLLSISVLLSWLVSPLHAEATKSPRLVLPSRPNAVVDLVDGRTLGLE